MQTWKEEELLVILEEHLPQDLTPEQIEAINSASQNSPKLREAILESLGFEDALAASYAPEPLDVSELIRRCQDWARQQRRGRWSSFARSVLAIVIVSAVSVGAWAIIQHFDSKSMPVAQQPPALDHHEPSSPSQLGDADQSQESEGHAEAPGLLADSTPQGTSVAVVESPEAEPLPEFDPAWRMYDDPALRGDQAWQNTLHKILLPRLPWRARRRPSGQISLDGTYVATTPKADGLRLRFAFSELTRLQWYFWQANGTDGVLVRWDAPTASLRAFSVHRKEVPEQNLRFRSDAGDLTSLPDDAMTRIDSNIDFKWNKQNLPAIEDGPGRVLACWHGAIQFPSGGDWRLAATTKGTVSILLDGNPVMFHGAISESKTSFSYHHMDAKEGEKPAIRDLEIQYYGDPEGDGLRLEWIRGHTGTSPRRVVPPDAFFLNDGDAAQHGLRATFLFSTEVDYLGPIEIGHMIAHDQSLWLRRFGTGSIDVRYEAGAIRLSRGDIELLVIPADEPDQFVMQTQCVLRGAEVLRIAESTVDVRSAKQRKVRGANNDYQHALVADQWAPEHEGDAAGLQIRSVDGGLEFLRQDSQAGQTALLPFDEAGGCEVTVRVDQATSGTGIVLKTPAADRHNLRLMVGEHDGHRVLYTNVLDPPHLRQCAERGWLVADQFWIRCEVAMNHTRMLFSNDAESWVAIQYRQFAPDTLIQPQFRIGVLAEHGEGARVLQLGELKVERLYGLEGLAEESWLAAAKRRLKSAEDWQASFQSILDAPEEGVSPSDWAVACHLAALHQPTTRTVREESVGKLLLAAVRADVSWDRLYPALVDLPRRLSTNKEMLSRGELAKVYRAMAMHLWNAGRRDELGRLVDAWHRQHWVSPAFLEEARLPEDLARFTLLGAAIEEDWDQLLTVSSREVFYSKTSRFSNRPINDATVRLAVWLQHTAAKRKAPENATEAKILAEWADRRMPNLPLPHPLVVEDRSRELETTWQEVRIAVAARQWDVAADAMLRLPAKDELVPVSSDDALRVSSRIAVGRLLGEYAALAEAINRKQRVGRMRLTRGMKYDDIDLVESVATLFSGTEVGRAATATLADRDLSRGEFLLAAGRYRSLLKGAEPSREDELQAKYRLAVAMGGQLLGTPTGKPVTLGGRTYPAEKFEKILQQAATVVVRSANLRNVRGANNDYHVAHSLTLAVPKTPTWEPTFFRTLAENRHAVRMFENPIDLGWASNDGHLFLHQQGRLTAIDTASGKTLFEVTEPIESNAEPRNGSIHPLVYGQYVIVPFYWATRSELTCFDRQTGAAVWRRPLDDAVISSPTASGDTLLTLSVKRQGGFGDVVLRRISPSSGSSLLTRVVARFRLGDALFQVGRLASHEDRILMRVGCTIICCDSAGSLQWVARLPYIPWEIRSYVSWADPWNWLHGQSLSDLLVIDDRVVATAPGSWNVECRDIRSGALVWRHQHPDLRHIVGQSEDRVIVATGGETLELDAATGLTAVGRSANSRGERIVHGADNDHAAFTDGQRLYRLRYADEKKVQIVLQVLESEE